MSADADNLHERAFEAVEGAVQWLVTNRRTASGTWRYGDEYTGNNGGFASTTEGLTSLLFARAEETHREDLETGDLVTEDLTDEMLQSDLEWLIEASANQRYPSTPYITDEVIEEFTDAAAFGLTAFILALNDPVGVDLRSDLQDRIAEAVDWFLDAQVDGETGAGWGHTHPDATEEPVIPQKYFTYSVTIALTDFLVETSGVADERRDEVRTAIEEAKEFLIHEGKMVQGYLNFEPQGDIDPIGKNAAGQPQLLPTCYVVWTLGYVGNRIDSFELSEAEHDEIEQSLEYLLQVNENADLLDYDEEYYVGRGTSLGDGYEDKTAPYAFFGAFADYPKWAYSGTGREAEAEYEQVRSNLAETIISECWAGNPENPELGFRHFENAGDINSDANVAAVYATEIAIESLLAFGLEKSVDTEFSDAVSDVLDTAKDDIVSLADQREVSTMTSDAELAEIEGQNKGYGKFYTTTLNKVREQFEKHSHDILENLAPAKMKKVKHGGSSFVGIHSERFFAEVLDKCYFESDPETFEKYVETYRSKHALIIKSYQDLLDELLALDVEELEPIEKKEEIESLMKRVEEDIFLNYTVSEITTDLKNRDI